MSMNFSKYYSIYYDLLYKDKNYELEVNYISDLIMKYKPDAQKLIDFGCGTGNHDVLFAKKGYEILGIDLSDSMIALANAKKEASLNLNFQQGDLRTFDSNQKFDVALALFHVMSYQVANADINQSIKTAYKQLKPGGIFIFDFWYGPGVLSDKPVTKIKRLNNEDIDVIRLTESELNVNDNTVNVSFEVLIKDKSTKRIETNKEIHKMRYFFIPELLLFLELENFKMLDYFHWLSSNKPTCESWNVVVICQK